MNFTEWLDSLTDPLYEANGLPECPPGYKWNKKTMACEPKTKKDNVASQDNKDSKPSNGPGFNVIGSHGQNGAPYAYEEPQTRSEGRDYDREDEEDKEFKKQDERMKYGKAGKPTSLKPGEVKRLKTKGGYSSNIKS